MLAYNSEYICAPNKFTLVPRLVASLHYFNNFNRVRPWNKSASEKCPVLSNYSEVLYLLSVRPEVNLRVASVSELHASFKNSIRRLAKYLQTLSGEKMNFHLIEIFIRWPTRIGGAKLKKKPRLFSNNVRRDWNDLVPWTLTVRENEVSVNIDGIVSLLDLPRNGDPDGW
jgi:hypothetical protein